MDRNIDEGVCYLQARTLTDRVKIANDFVARFNYAIPLGVDTMDDAASRIYAGWPERLYVITEDGRIAYKGGMGPFHYKPEEVRAWLEARFPQAVNGAPTPAIAAGGL